MSDTIYVKSTASLDVAHDSSFTMLDHRRDKIIISEEYTYAEAGTVKIAGAADHVVNLGSITTVKSLYVETESQVDVYLDTQAVPIKLRPGTKTGMARVLLDALSATALKFTNPVTGGSDARVTYQIVGD
jgi:hypothetical protein